VSAVHLVFAFHATWALCIGERARDSIGGAGLYGRRQLRPLRHLQAKSHPMIYGLDQYNRCRVCKTILDPGAHCENHFRMCAWCEKVLPIEYFLPTGYLCRGCRH